MVKFLYLDWTHIPDVTKPTFDISPVLKETVDYYMVLLRDKNVTPLREFFEISKIKPVSYQPCHRFECLNMYPVTVNEPKFKRCSGCNSVRYCSAVCQKLDWSEVHKHECATLAKLNGSHGWIF